MEYYQIYWSSYIALEDELINALKYVFLSDTIENLKNESITSHNSHQLSTYSPYIADLLIRICVQIEALAKELYFEDKDNDTKLNIKNEYDRCYLSFLDKKYEIGQKVVRIVYPFCILKEESNYKFRPLNNSHKGKQYWQKCYQAVKHNKYYNLEKGNIKAVIHALAALFLLNIYKKNIRLTLTIQKLYEKDFGFGSKFFIVNKPSMCDFEKENIPIRGDSPFVYTLDEAALYFHRKEVKEEHDKYLNFIYNLPEFKDPNFSNFIQKGVENPNSRNNILVKIFEYRLKNLIPSNVSFNEKIKILSKSEEWERRKILLDRDMELEFFNEENFDEKIKQLAYYNYLYFYHYYHTKRVMLSTYNEIPGFLKIE